MLSSAQLAISTTAVLLGAPDGTMRVRLYNAGPNNVYLGPAGVTSSTGARLANGATEAFDVDEDFYAICANAESATLHVLRTGEGGVHASLTTALAGTHNDLKFTAMEPGAPGNSYTVAYVVAGNNTPLSVSRTGRAFTVNVKTSDVGAALSTAAEVRAALQAAYSGYLTIELAAGNDGTGVVTALAATALTGGS